MKYLSNNHSEIFKKGINSYIDDLVSDTKSAYEGILGIDISHKLCLKSNLTRFFLKDLSCLIDDALKVLSRKIDWAIEEDREAIYEFIFMHGEFDRLYRALTCVFKVFSFFILAKLSNLKLVLCGTRKISARSDSSFKCILGHYRGKYRRITRASEIRFINASSVCGGEA